MDKNGGPAFPSANEIQLGNYGTTGHTGMSLRDYFAAAGLQGILAGTLADGTPLDKDAPENVAWTAYKIADAMLKAREGK